MMRRLDRAQLRRDKRSTDDYTGEVSSKALVSYTGNMCTTMAVVHYMTEPMRVRDQLYPAVKDFISIVLKLWKIVTNQGHIDLIERKYSDKEEEDNAMIRLSPASSLIVVPLFVACGHQQCMRQSQYHMFDKSSMVTLMRDGRLGVGATRFYHSPNEIDQVKDDLQRHIIDRVGTKSTLSSVLVFGETETRPSMFNLQPTRYIPAMMASRLDPLSKEFDCNQQTCAWFPQSQYDEFSILTSVRLRDRTTSDIEIMTGMIYIRPQTRTTTKFKLVLGRQSTLVAITPPPPQSS